MRAELTERRIEAAQRFGQPLAAVAALAVLVVALSTDDQYYAPRWPLTVPAVILALGLFAGPLAQRVSGQVVHGVSHTVAAAVTLVVFVFALSGGTSPTWPLSLTALVLGLGLAAARLGDLVDRRRRTARSVQSVMAVAALDAIVIVVGRGDVYYSPKWPFTITAVLLAAGLIAGAIAPRGRGRGRLTAEAATTGAAVMSLIVLIDGLSNLYVAPRWSLWVVVALLGVGLAAGPLRGLVGGQPLQRAAQPVAAVAAMVVLVVGASGATVFSTTWPLGLTLVLLGAGLVVGRLAQLAGAESVRRSAQPVAAIAGMIVLVGALSIDSYLVARGPVTIAIVILGLGLALMAGPIAQFVGEPRVKALSARVDELSRTRRGALDVQASELRRIERDLHDGAQARLVALSMKLGRAEDRYRDDAETAALLREAREDAAAAIRELRELARGIAPPVLTDRGLEAAVRSLAQRSGADVRVSGALSRRPLPAVETAAYFVVAESLTNAAKHAPGAPVEIRLDERGGDLFVEVTDFGPGDADPTGGGLTGLRQRVEALDGDLHVTSPSGVGTQVEAVLPCGR